MNLEVGVVISVLECSLLAGGHPACVVGKVHGGPWSCCCCCDGRVPACSTLKKGLYDAHFVLELHRTCCNSDFHCAVIVGMVRIAHC